jgi:hypothetical protein
MASSENNILRQYGALPFLMTEEGEVRLLLVTTRGQRGWIIPKGWPIRHLTGDRDGSARGIRRSRRDRHHHR